MESDLKAATKAAWAAHERGDWPDAIRHWRTCIRLDPAMGAAYWMGGALLLSAGRLDEAEAMLSEGVKRDPANVGMAFEHAKAAAALKHWPEAIRRWNALVRRAPDKKEVREGRDQFVMQLRSHEIDANIDGGAAGIDWDSLGAAAGGANDRELFMQFESLGDDCEFGLVQRYFGADPLSLLRWNAIGIGGLIAGIEDGFSSVGDPQDNELQVIADELALCNRRYGMAMHTFIRAAHVAPADLAALHTKMCRRMIFLGRKLMEDLKAPSKTFLFKTVNGASVQEIQRLHQAMERHGPNRLLYVVEADAERPASSIEEIAPRLLVGAIGHLWHRPSHWDTIDNHGWRDLCRNVAAFVGRVTPAAGPEPPPRLPLGVPAPAEPVPRKEANGIAAPAPPRPAPSARGGAWDLLTKQEPPIVGAPPPSAPPRRLFSRVLGALRRP